jgi:hypothetical protein
MAKSIGQKSKYPVRSHYIVKFSDENFQMDWKVKNLLGFIRSLYESNKILRDAWAGVCNNAVEFSVKMAGKTSVQLYFAREGRESNTANLFLLPRDHKDYKVFYATVSRYLPMKDEVANTLTVKKFKR